MLTDNHGRNIDYLRLAVTDRCNLRCFYCMPAEGLNWLSREELLSTEETLRLSRIMIDMGITKIRITGGEPFVRKDTMHLLEQLAALPKLKELTVTTNGVLTAPLVPRLKELGVKSVNLSLDTLNAGRFFAITGRDEFAAVMKTLDALLTHGIGVKINTVVMANKNIADIRPLCELARNAPVNVRFIEEMPFNGDSHILVPEWNYQRILDEVKACYPDLYKVADDENSTSYNYKIPGFKGSLGVIAAYSRTFCGTCNRIRVTPTGTLKTCLYDGGVLDVRSLMRIGNTDEQLKTALMQAFTNRPANGFEAERQATESSTYQSMAFIGG